MGEAISGVLGRVAESAVSEAMADTPVVLLLGPRQCGKSTVAQTVAKPFGATLVTLDDPASLRFAEQDPAGFLQSISPKTPEGFTRAVIDEIQKAPGLFPVIKAEVDRNRTPGRFLLTGSANVLSLPKLAESLAGRMEPIDLFPFSQSELAGRRGGFVDALFSGSTASFPKSGATEDIFERVEAGGFPEPVLHRTSSRRRQWFQSYLRTMIERDIQEISHIERSPQLHRLLSLLAVRVGSATNRASLANDAGLSQSTLARYMELLQAVYLIQAVTPWWTNASTRLVKAPKHYFVDSGLMASVAGLDAAAMRADRTRFGPLLENFVANELLKQCRWGRIRPELSYFRTSTQLEVDFVLEDRQRRIVGIEVKASATVQPSDLKGLRHLRELSGDRFLGGVVLNLSDQVAWVDREVQAMPVSALWEFASEPI